jgi:MPBQ/MSBQ methyltransferase
VVYCKEMPRNIQPDIAEISHLFNEMADEYDHLSDLWYSYSFSRIDSIIKDNFSIPHSGDPERQIVVDVGCGTGIQSLRFAQLGYRVVGIDIAEELLKIAEQKLHSHFPARATFIRGDAQCLPVPDKAADVVNCCGPTISFVPDYERAFAEMARVLRSGGRLIIECEQKWNLDMFWEVVNAVLGNVYGYDESLGEALRHFLPPWRKGHYVKYAFRTESDNKSYMFLKLFTPSELQYALERLGFVVEQKFGIHIVTNIIPSTVLHDASPTPAIKQFFGFLADAENLIYNKWPFYNLGCSLVVIAKKL